MLSAHGFDTLDMKPLVRFATNRLDLFIKIKQQKETKKKWNQGLRGTLHDKRKCRRIVCPLQGQNTIPMKTEDYEVMKY